MTESAILQTVADSLGFISPPVDPAALVLPQPLKLGVLASGSGSNFGAIAQAIHDRTLNAQIQVLIYNNPKATAKDRAAQFGIPTVLLNHRHYDSREALDDAIVTTLKAHGVDWVVMAGWMRIVTAVLIDAFPDRVLNIHPSLLPSFPGIHGVEQALAAGVKVTGCTVHIAHLAVDSGPIIMQAAVPILPDDTADSLHARIQVQEHRIYPQAIALAAHLAQL
ncbi:phosphoribosylglycinamide formyltransferase [Spirulina major CS-329]|uniref:phosphoribosylglycinamide formyltransferase n=1 Tax=Spirulina TaxID=1154 RepID=UPI00232C1C31|nr:MULTISPECIES: phosphoribosylglycinamide formyltransferase [Spirulina]MDB9496436.1 phosphoribosylglycinamide formyltransferase [Spirulina subsalsa CS-330]MDB9502072.1 phosphoribosylglycinamide formyltransferase [Spirulina major CS-329]